MKLSFRVNQRILKPPIDLSAISSDPQISNAELCLNLIFNHILDPAVSEAMREDIYPAPIETIQLMIETQLLGGTVDSDTIILDIPSDKYIKLKAILAEQKAVLRSCSSTLQAPSDVRTTLEPLFAQHSAQAIFISINMEHENSGTASDVESLHETYIPRDSLTCDALTRYNKLLKPLLISLCNKADNIALAMQEDYCHLSILGKDIKFPDDAKALILFLQIADEDKTEVTDNLSTSPQLLNDWVAQPTKDESHASTEGSITTTTPPDPFGCSSAPQSFFYPPALHNNTSSSGSMIKEQRALTISGKQPLCRRDKSSLFKPGRKKTTPDRKADFVNIVLDNLPAALLSNMACTSTSTPFELLMKTTNKEQFINTLQEMIYHDRNVDPDKLINLYDVLACDLDSLIKQEGSLPPASNQGPRNSP